jgi:hypothetical protein
MHDDSMGRPCTSRNACRLTAWLHALCAMPPLQVCPPGSKWLVVTNGDNEYAEDFMQRVGEAIQMLCLSLNQKY